MNKALTRCGRGLFFYMDVLGVQFCGVQFFGLLWRFRSGSYAILTALIVKADHEFVPLFFKKRFGFGLAISRWPAVAFRR